MSTGPQHSPERYVRSGEDKSDLGWWKYVEIAGREKRKVVLITGYGPCIQSNPQDSTVMAQQKHLLTQKAVHDIQPLK
eukprot:6293731-Ditylum_brightwellii.AAC.1